MLLGLHKGRGYEGGKCSCHGYACRSHFPSTAELKVHLPTACKLCHLGHLACAAWPRKLCMFQGHSCVKNRNCKLCFLESYPVYFICMFATYFGKIVHNKHCEIISFLFSSLGLKCESEINCSSCQSSHQLVVCCCLFWCGVFFFVCVCVLWGWGWGVSFCFSKAIFFSICSLL